MKHLRFFAPLIFFTAILFFGCQQESLTPDEPSSPETSADWIQTGEDGVVYRGKGNNNGNGNGNGNGGGGGSGGGSTSYQVEYIGVIGGVTFGPATKDNKKTQLIEAGEGDLIFTGIGTLVGGCFPDYLENIWGPSVRLIDKRKIDVEKRVSVWLFITYNGSNHWLKFFGYICSDPGCGGPGGSSILPGTGETVWLKMDRIVVNTDLGCEQDEPLSEDVRVKITQVP